MRLATRTDSFSCGIWIPPRVPCIRLRMVAQCLVPASTKEIVVSKGAVVDSSVNGLLAALPETSRERLFAKTQLVSLSAGEILDHPGGPITSVCVPLSCVISMMAEMKKGAAVEIATVRREGLHVMQAF